MNLLTQFFALAIFASICIPNTRAQPKIQISAPGIGPEALHKKNASFDIRNPYACPDEYVDFKIEPQETEVLEWDFGDGHRAFYKYSAWHMYSSVGTYQVSATISEGGIIRVLHDTVYIVNNLPVQQAELTISDDVVCPGELVTFYPDRFSIKKIWDFGDGNTSNLDSPRHIYNSTGIYPVALTVSNGCGYDSTLFDTLVVTDTIKVRNAQLNYSFYNKACPGEPVNFYADPTDLLYEWDLGDNNNTLNNHFKHTYNNMGTYPVSVTISNLCGDDTTLYDTIKYNDVKPINRAPIYISDQYTFPCDSILFTTNKQQSYHWNLGDGHISSQWKVWHQYSDTGRYPVSLNVQNGCGYDTTVHDTVYVYNDYYPTDHDDVYRIPFEGCPGDSLMFICYINGYEFEWDFGDGTTSDNKNALHIYDSAGYYDVSLFAKNDCDVIFTMKEHVDIGFDDISTDQVYRLFAYSIHTCVEDIVEFKLYSLGYSTNLNYSVDFGDGTSAPVYFDGDYLKTKHQYSDTGTYRAILNVSNNCGSVLVDSFPFYGHEIFIKVRENITIKDGFIKFSFDESDYYITGQALPTIHDSIRFFFSNGHHDSGEWNFDDGSPVLLTDRENKYAIHQYTKPGNYLVKANITNSCGYTETFYKRIIVNEKSLHNIQETEPDKPDILVYPNPSNDGIFYINTNQTGHDNLFVDVFNLNGQKIYSQQLHSTSLNHTIHLSGRPAGLYLVRIYGNHINCIKKLIIR